MIPAGVDWVRRLSAMTGARLLLWAVLATWFIEPHLQLPHHTGWHHDWAYFTHHAMSAFRTYVNYHQFPVWDPYHCGGIPALGSVANNSGSPNLLLSLLFGFMPGRALAAWLFFVLGMEGTFRYALHKGMSGLGALFAAVVFALSGRFAKIFFDGQPENLNFLLTPWIVLGYERGIRENRWLVVGAVFMGWQFVEGGVNSTPMMAVTLGVLAVFHTVVALATRQRTVAWYRPMLALAIMAALTVMLTAYRFLPAAENLLAAPRLWLQPESYSLRHVLGMLYERVVDNGYAGVGTAYIGMASAALFALAVLRFDRVALGLFVITAILVMLAMGNGSPLYDAIMKLPVIENLRAPFRYIWFIAFFAAVGAGRGLYLMDAALAKRVHRLRWWWARTAAAVGVAVLLPVVGFVAAAEAAEFNARRIEGLFTREPAMVREAEFQQSLGNRWHADVWVALNLGTIGCFEEQPFPTSSALRGDLAQEEYLADPTAGTVRRLYWSPHRIELEVDLERPAILLVNQNAHRAWQTSVGDIVEHEGLVAAQLPAGAYPVTITYFDAAVAVGGAVAITTAVGLGGLGLWSRRKRRPVR